MFDIDNFIVSCESMKIYPHDIGMELFNRDMSGKMHLSKKSRDKANKNHELRPILTKMQQYVYDLYYSKKMDDKIKAAFNKALTIIKSSKKYSEMTPF